MRTIYVYERRKTKPTVKVLEESTLENGGIQRTTVTYKSKGHPVGVAAILLPEEGEGSTMYIGAARCALSDTFIKKEGRRIALEKAERIRDLHKEHPNMPQGRFDFKHQMGTAPVSDLEDVIEAMKRYSEAKGAKQALAENLDQLKAMAAFMPPELMERVAMEMLGTAEGTGKGKNIAREVLADCARVGLPVPPKVQAKLLDMAHKEG